MNFRDQRPDDAARLEVRRNRHLLDLRAQVPVTDFTVNVRVG
jgi:hypothetical protein